ncbi:MAG: D-2-hydroxyacid dehydrogenase [Sphingomonas sp.]
MTETRNILFWNVARDAALERSLSGLDQVDLVVANEGPDMLERLPRADGFIVSAAHVSPPLIEGLNQCDRLRWIHLINAGYDNVTRQSLPDGLVVTHTPGAGATTVAEHGLGLMLALARRLPEAIEAQRSKRWDYGLGARLSSLQGKTLMVLGFGHIGKALAVLARTFGMQVIAVSKHGHPSELADRSCRLGEAAGYLPDADFVVIAAPLTPETRTFFNAERLALIGARAFLINLSRGGIVDSDALSAKLREGALAGAALDVTEPEPLPAEHPLWTAPNLILTPHAAAAGPTPHDCRHLVAITTENARRFSRGEPLLHVVHPCTLQAA